jgi:hypothetical protein
MERRDEHSRANPEPDPVPGATDVTQPESTEHGTTHPRAEARESDRTDRYEGMPEEGPGAGDAARVYAEGQRSEPGTSERPDHGGEGLVDRIKSALGQNDRSDDRSDDRPGERPGERQAEWRGERQGAVQPEQEGHDADVPSSVEGRMDSPEQDRYAPQDRYASEERQADTVAPESSAATASPAASEARDVPPEGTQSEAYSSAPPDTSSAQDRPGAPRAEGSLGVAGEDTAYDAAAERKAVAQPGAETRPAEGLPTERPAGTTAERSDDDAGAAGGQATPGAVSFVEQTAVISRQDADTFQARWETIQGTFIDDPHAATEQADELVGEVMDRLASLRQEYLTQLRRAVGDGSDTEAMRVALQRYRAFFQLLLG